MFQLIKRFFCLNIDNLLRKDPRMNWQPQVVIRPARVCAEIFNGYFLK